MKNLWRGIAIFYGYCYVQFLYTSSLILFYGHLGLDLRLESLL